MKDKKLFLYIAVVAVLFIGLIVVELNRKTPVDWTPTFINTDKNPYGTYIVFDLLDRVFPESNIKVSRFPVANELDYVPDNDFQYYYDDDFENGKIEDNNSRLLFDDALESYIFINGAFGIKHSFRFDATPGSYEINDLDIKSLLKFVNEGNNVFIAAERMSPLLLDTLKVTVKMEWASTDSILAFKDIVAKDYSYRSINGPLYYFASSDTAIVSYQALAETKKEHKPVFIRVAHGNGFFYLNTLPVAFSNVELLDVEKYEFAFRCLSFLPKNNNIIWDEYLKQGRIGENSVFRVVWNHPAMLWAYYILLTTGLLFMIFRSKRMQRIIPVIEPPANTSLEFLDTLSNLYYEKDAYRSIVRKRHLYFLDMVRTRYYMNTEVIDDEFFDMLAAKSGVERNILTGIFDCYDSIEYANVSISNNMLLKYNETLEEFYDKMK